MLDLPSHHSFPVGELDHDSYTAGSTRANSDRPMHLLTDIDSRSI